jgi:ATP-dependent Lon protease
METVELTKGEVLELYLGLNSLGELHGAKFAYAVMRNINSLKGEAEALLEARNPKQEYVIFEREQISLAKLHAVMKDGVPQKYTENGKEFYAIADMEKFNKEFEALREKHLPAINNYQAQLRELESILKEKVTVGIYKVSREFIPENISVKQFASIEAIISDDVDKG